MKIMFDDFVANKIGMHPIEYKNKLNIIRYEYINSIMERSYEKTRELITTVDCTIYNNNVWSNEMGKYKKWSNFNDMLNTRYYAYIEKDAINENKKRFVKSMQMNRDFKSYLKSYFDEHARILRVNEGRLYHPARYTLIVNNDKASELLGFNVDAASINVETCDVKSLFYMLKTSVDFCECTINYKSKDDKGASTLYDLHIDRNNYKTKSTAPSLSSDNVSELKRLSNTVLWV